MAAKPESELTATDGAVELRPTKRQDAAAARRVADPGFVAQGVPRSRSCGGPNPSDRRGSPRQGGGSLLALRLEGGHLRRHPPVAVNEIKKDGRWAVEELAKESLDLLAGRPTDPPPIPKLELSIGGPK